MPVDPVKQSKKQRTHKRNTKGLILFKKGKSGNAKGSSKAIKRKMAFKAWMEENAADAPEVVYKKLIELAKAGRDFRFMQEFLDRSEGKVPQKQELTGKDGKDLTFNVKVLDANAQKMIDDLNKRLLE